MLSYPSFISVLLTCGCGSPHDHRHFSGDEAFVHLAPTAAKLGRDEGKGPLMDADEGKMGRGRACGDDSGGGGGNSKL